METPKLGHHQPYALDDHDGGTLLARFTTLLAHPASFSRRSWQASLALKPFHFLSYRGWIHPLYPNDNLVHDDCPPTSQKPNLRRSGQKLDSIPRKLVLPRHLQCYHTHQTGTLTSTNDVTANFTFVFPQAAYGFYYYGIRRSHGASYQVCVDCDPEDMQWVDIPNTRNATDDGKNPPVVLYSQTWDTPDVHRVIITNRPDPNFNNTSQLTIDRIDLLVKDPLAPATPPPEASASGGSSTTAAIASAPSNSTMNNAVSSNSGARPMQHSLVGFSAA